ncbi:MAG TPA: nuclear transport factor 2 family protein [Candidatus Binatia bacterium]|nr:nuclear transport factor 2 family protein [Candidatus Binatia bacterium]
MTDAIDRYIDAIRTATIPAADSLDPDVVLDATVPNWRFTVRGADAVRAELARWYADPGQFEEIKRTELPGGALVEFVLSWEERGEPHLCHQAHVIRVSDGMIVRDTAWCGGRWGAALMAEMAEAEAGGG